MAAAGHTQGAIAAAMDGRLLPLRAHAARPSVPSVRRLPIRMRASCGGRLQAMASEPDILFPLVELPNKRRPRAPRIIY